MRRIIEYNDAKHVVVSGDIHGDFKGIVYKLCIQYGLTDTLLIDGVFNLCITNDTHILQVARKLILISVDALKEYPISTMTA